MNLTRYTEKAQEGVLEVLEVPGGPGKKVLVGLLEVLEVILGVLEVVLGVLGVVLGYEPLIF